MASRDDDNAFDAFLEAALRGESTDGLEVDDTSPEVREAILGLGRILRGDAEAAATSRLQPAPDLPFESLGEFRLIRQLGAGGMGVVYLAEQPSLGRLVALKVLRPERAGSEAEVRFRREMQAVAQLHHPNIVAVFASGEDRGVSYLAMELVPGRGLDELVDEARKEDAMLPAQQAVRWGAQIASALDAAHREGFLHRDVKPSNVRIHKDGRAMLLDFGLARKIDSQTFTTTGAMTGSPYYASPEQIGGPRSEVTESSDIYSLGVTLYECLTGHLPFVADDPARLLNLILNSEPQPLRSLRPDLPAALETVVQCAMERSRARRYASARQLRDDLDAVLDLRPIQARRAGPATRMVRLLRRNLPATVLIAAVLLILIVVGLLQLGDRLTEQRAFDRLLGQARTSQQAGEFTAALTAVDQALGLRGNDSGAALLRLEVERAQQQATARQAEARARQLLAEFAEQAVARGAARNTVHTLEPKQYLRWLFADEREQLDQARRQLKRIERGIEESRFQVEDAINSAALLGSPGDALTLKAELYLELWRIADRTGDPESRRLYRRIVEENDPNGRLADEFESRGRLSLGTDPAGAEVHLFRYESLSDLVLDGEDRQVPVPLDRVLPVAPGQTVLRVTEDHAPLRRGDLILSVEGRPVTTNFLEQDGELADEYLVAIDGQPVSSANFLRWEPFERILRQGVRTAADLEPVEHLFDSLGERISRQAGSFRDLGFRVLNASEAIHGHGPLFGHRYRDGVIDEIELPAETLTRLTAAPLFAGPTTRIGVTPIRDLELDRGSYVVLLRHPGHVEVRRPLRILQDAETAVQVRLPRSSERPTGMAYIPGGPFQMGGDPEAPFANDARTVDMEPFWIGETEVTAGEYARYLNDPSTPFDDDPQSPDGPVPPAVLPSNSSKRWELDARGQWQPPGGLTEHPVFSVSYTMANDYVRWLNRTRPPTDGSLVYSLPTEAEWEKAAGGMDGRPYPFGSRFEPLWVCCRFSRIVPVPELVNSYPVDESPFGVFDTCGNMMEWCSEIFSPRRRRLMLMKGGSWGLAQPSDFRIGKRVGEVIDDPRNMAGLRIVLRPR